MAFYGPYVWRLWLVGGVWGREYDITRNVFENPVPVLRRKISLGFLGDYIGRPLEVGIIRVKGLFLKMGRLADHGSYAAESVIYAVTGKRISIR